MPHFKTLLQHVKAFAFDVDGVFSSSQLVLHPSGDMMRSMNIKDGYAIKRALEAGFPVAIITGGTSESVRIRFQALGTNDVYLRAHDKLEHLKDFMHIHQLRAEDILYMGDDMPDYEVMLRVGLPVCPADAVSDIKAISKYISDRKGGDACVRDVVEQVLRAHGLWK